LADKDPLSTSEDGLPARNADDADNGLSVRRLASLVAAIVAGAGGALFLLSRIFTWIPTDIQRLGILAETLRTQNSTPEIVVFGNSAIMSGIDARGLTDAIPEHPLAWNFASTGQSLVESYLLTQDLPTGVKTAIYGIFARPGPDASPLHPQKYNTLYMYGYRPNKDTVATIESLFDPSVGSLLKRSAISQVFLSRWAVRQLIDTQLRVLLRSDLALRKSAIDLFDPQRYETPIDPVVTARRIAERNSVFEATPPIVSAPSTRLALQIVRDAARANRQIIFLFPARTSRPVLPERIGDDSRNERIQGRPHGRAKNPSHRRDECARSNAFHR
jgi:hypothetical protein